MWLFEINFLLPSLCQLLCFNRFLCTTVYFYQMVNSAFLLWALKVPYTAWLIHPSSFYSSSGEQHRVIYCPRMFGMETGADRESNHQPSTVTCSTTWAIGTSFILFSLMATFWSMYPCFWSHDFHIAEKQQIYWHVPKFSWFSKRKSANWRL